MLPGFKAECTPSGRWRPVQASHPSSSESLSQTAALQPSMHKHTYTHTVDVLTPDFTVRLTETHTGGKKQYVLQLQSTTMKSLLQPPDPKDTFNTFNIPAAVVYYNSSFFLHQKTKNFLLNCSLLILLCLCFSLAVQMNL